MPARIVGVGQLPKSTGDYVAEGVSKGVQQHFQEKAQSELAALEVVSKGLMQLPEEQRSAFLASPKGKRILQIAKKYGYPLEDIAGVPESGGISSMLDRYMKGRKELGREVSVGDFTRRFKTPEEIPESESF